MAGRILVLDDEENYAEMLQELLREHNYRVDMATRPERAIALLEEIPYDLVISDYKMPVMDGADFLKRARELYPNLPVILVSGLMNTPELVKVANMSVTLVLEKPLDISVFLKHVARFSAPMSDEEKVQLSAQNEANLSVTNCPEEARFISAGSVASKRFMRQLWALCKKGSHCFLLEPVGGEVDLALKDISAWRGNHDKSVQVIAFQDLLDGGADKLESLLENVDQSDVVSVRLANVEDIVEAKTYLAQAYVSKVLTGEPNLLLAFIVSSTGVKDQFVSASGASGLVLPKLRDRPSDVAKYIVRFLRIAAERLDKSSVVNLSEEAAYALLSYQWSSCREIQEVVTQLVANSDDGSLDGALVCAILKQDASDQPAAPQRLGALLKLSQSRYLERQVALDGQLDTDLVKSLGFASATPTAADIKAAPLLQADLSEF